MAYFIVLPAFLAWLFIAFGVLLALRIRAPSWRGRPYVFHASLWASIGVLLANALLVACLALGVGLLSSGTEAEAQRPGQGLFQVVWGALAILGPFLASAIGWGLGLLVGVLVAHGRHQSAAT